MHDVKLNSSDMMGRNKRGRQRGSVVILVLSFNYLISSEGQELDLCTSERNCSVQVSRHFDGAAIALWLGRLNGKTVAWVQSQQRPGIPPPPPDQYLSRVDSGS